MKKIIITVTIITTLVTTKVGYHEYSDWRIERDSIASNEAQRKIAIEYINNTRKHLRYIHKVFPNNYDLKSTYLNIIQENCYKQEECLNNINYYTKKSEIGFWRSIFNAF
jgi:hypothetical protein